MFDNPPVKFFYVQEPLPPRKKLRRPPNYLSPRSNRVLPRPKFTCIDEVYSPAPASIVSSVPTNVTAVSSSQLLKSDKVDKTQKWQRWSLIIIVIIIIACIIGIIVLLAVFLTR